MRTPMKTKERMIWIMVPVLAICNGFLMPNAAAQSDTYPKMAPVDQYLMEKSAETQLTQSAAPDYMSRDATVLVLGRQGYRLPLKATTGFVCRKCNLRDQHNSKRLLRPHQTSYLKTVNL